MAPAPRISALIRDTTLLFVSHHGARSNDSNSDEWASGVRPAIVVYSADTKPDYGHPKGEVVKRYRDPGSLENGGRILSRSIRQSNSSAKETSKRAEYVTELNGTVIVESDGISKVGVTCSRSPNCW